MADFLRKVTTSIWFHQLVTVVILIYCVVIGLETSPYMQQHYGTELELMDRIILGLFVLEIVLRIGAEGKKPWRFFYDPWNVFDFVIVAVCLIPNLENYVFFGRLARIIRAIARASRILRVLRLGQAADFLHKLTSSNAFQHSIVGVILFSAVVVGLETSNEIMAEYGELLELFDRIILIVFTVEIVMRMGAAGSKPWLYFKDPWNWFDVAIVAICWLPVESNYIVVVRLGRVFRTLRLATALPKLQIIVAALLQSIPSMCYVGLLLMLHFYIYAVAGVFLWGENDPGEFGTLPKAMLTLFRVITLEDWTDVMYTQMFGSDEYPSQLPAYPDQEEPYTSENPQRAVILGALYFVSFVLFGTMIMLNLFIGVIMTTMQEVHGEAVILHQMQKEETQEPETLLQRIENLETQLEKMKMQFDEQFGQLRTGVHLLAKLLKEEEKQKKKNNGKLEDTESEDAGETRAAHHQDSGSS
ncbi:MAG: ion transporter [Gemmataceae bacterium]